MHRLVIAVIFAATAVAVAARPVHAQTTQPTADTTAAVQGAQAAGEAWLALLMEGKGKETWAETSKHFQAAVPEAAWVQQVAALRTQLGTFEGRTLDQAEYATDVPNAPPGEYVALIYKSEFANLESAREVLSLTFEDGHWKVVGYFVQPAGD